ncbi:SdpI family protein [Sediminivirga luteola]|uniref:SdpI/YhfL family protein n=1 Tax=Sediminivirga luteola TaxID=1774748 RepID=A0A8J2TXN6_9MICO|nr:SdpI family protein [Sediminivirga luteola]MCI2266576.1 SdpI family protein [Sediminivirga luteola]GGA12921.1 hypothetical protein GCM10011333_14780 [Sediminivirga luteola]
MPEELIARALLACSMMGSGVLLLWIAEAAANGRLRRNQLAGIRTAATLASDEAWLAAHRRARPSTRWAGWCAVLGGVPAVLPVPLPIFAGAALLGCLGMIGLVLYGAAVGTAAARTAGSGSDS